MNEWTVVFASLAGAVVGGVLTLANNRWSWRWNHTRRWDSRRLHVYQDFLASVLRAQRQWAVRHRSDTARRLIRDSETALDQVVTSVAALNLVASSNVKYSADSLLNALNDLVEKATSVRASRVNGPWSAYDDSGLADVLDTFVSERSAFERAVQLELQVR